MPRLQLKIRRQKVTLKRVASFFFKFWLKKKQDHQIAGTS